MVEEGTLGQSGSLKRFSYLSLSKYDAAVRRVTVFLPEATPVINLMTEVQKT